MCYSQVVRNSPSQLDEDCLHGVVALPLGQTGELLGVDNAVPRVDTGQVDLADELDLGWLIGVVLAAVHLEAVNAVFVDGLQRVLALPPFRP